MDIKKLEQAATHQGYLRRIAVVIDKALNVVTLGAPDDTISSRMERWKLGDVPHPNAVKKIAGQFMCWWLGKIQPDHDIRANAGDLGRAEAEERRTRKTLKDAGV
jgi:hypothetical protein